MPPADRTRPDDDRAVHARRQTHVDVLGNVVVADNAANPLAVRRQTRPGVGQILGPVLALEIDQLARFPAADKPGAYAGLVPTTHASGGQFAHGRMLPCCNHGLKWACSEAACVAGGCSG